MDNESPLADKEGGVLAVWPVWGARFIFLFVSSIGKRLRLKLRCLFDARRPDLRRETQGQATVQRNQPQLPTNSNHTPVWVVLLLILVLGGFLGVIYFGKAPPGLNQDEAVNAWNAYCLLKTGQDQVGVRWPVVLCARHRWQLDPALHLPVDTLSNNRRFEHNHNTCARRCFRFTDNSSDLLRRQTAVQ